jgi:hypothetical protein
MKIFSWSVVCLFISVTVFSQSKHFSICRSQVCLSFMDCAFGAQFNNYLTQGLLRFSSMLSFGHFIILHFTFRYYDLNFWLNCEVQTDTHFLTFGFQLLQHHLLRRLLFSSMTCLCIFVKGQSWGGGSSVIECLPNMHKTLAVIPNMPPIHTNQSVMFYVDLLLDCLLFSLQYSLHWWLL